MASFTRGILIGRHDLEAIATLVEDTYAPVLKTEALSGTTLAGVVTFQDAQDSDERELHVYDASFFTGMAEDDPDNREAYEGERTAIRLGATGDSVAVMRGILAVTGGYLCEDDWEATTYVAIEAAPAPQVF